MGSLLVPVASSPAIAEWLWTRAREMLAHSGFPTEPRRLAALHFRRGFEAKALQLGVEDSDTGELVLFIFRSANAPFYWVLTPANGLFEGAPIPVPDRPGTWAVEWGEGVEGPVRKKRRRPSRRAGFP
jgi:hypothetical protein